MGTAPDRTLHSKILTQAGREVLAPMGLVQKGRSRTWLDDHGWWVGVVGFQPSGFSRGSYLNVGCTWLWVVKDYISYDVGGRVEVFRPFESESQFQSHALALARRAALEIGRYREMFPDAMSVARYYRQHRPDDIWSMFHAGVGSGLAGQIDDARRYLLEVSKLPSDGLAWVEALQSDACDLSRLDHAALEMAVRDRIKRAREALKLPPTDA